jgi:hypothetical protein
MATFAQASSTLLENLEKFLDVTHYTNNTITYYNLEFDTYICYNPVFYKHRQSLHLYKYSKGALAEYKIKN